MSLLPPRPCPRAALALCLASPLLASAAPPATTELPAVRVDARAEGFPPAGPVIATKSDLPLARTPLSIDVLGRGLLDSQQVHSLGEALQNSAGVVADVMGRRGWDDFIIRGQTATSSVFVDGLRSAATNRMAEQTYALEQVEVLKGPASLLYGDVQPGGMLNLVSKRPRAVPGGSAELAIGGYGLRQLAADIGQPFGAGRAAVRVTALAMNRDDPTDHVWARERFIAPTLSLDFGHATDFVLLTSYQQRRYIRQQGLPLRGAVFPNPNGPLRRTLFTGEPTQAPYDGDQARVGWQLDHAFANGWRLHQGLRWQSTALDGDFVTSEGLLADARTLRRGARRQHWGSRTWVQDTYLSRLFGNARFSQALTIGLDAFRTWEWLSQEACRPGRLDVYAPVYTGLPCAQARITDTFSRVTSGGLYLRDALQWGERWQLLLGLRHDRSRTESEDRLRGRRQRNNHSANTGSAALMYEVLPGLRPYLSFATSFTPNAGVDAFGSAFAPEQGRQVELGAKYALGDKALLTAALYDLRRRNVLQNDPRHEGFQTTSGEQRSRGGEISLQADLADGLSANFAYAYTDAWNPDAGKPLPNVPRNSGSLWLRHDAKADNAGFYVGAGARAASARSGYGYRMPGYLVLDAGVGWRGQGWDLALNARNLLDRDYYSGGLERAVAVGDPRTWSLRLRYDY
ncbi:IclR family transcriptional regulator [Stenotrophomonas panacihumi]|uniref:IclR family transcriptional regulator n=1 Tax=Stenotrophomonas panacihumi TaxID=676599 RepID=A0A0R0AW37_9GAMM|nr:TonB-dependent siderophore receptor [Stenotrophomonas panacihumi]KRG49275.1 IclR family transcriptional regulator [Stenotrophomonas panacihumi]PTN53958.1 TonB-dependent siderophore receptor [Stenotrophomonas panacihumi]